MVQSSQVPVVPQLRGREYSIFNNSHPYQGEEIFNSTPQVENQSIGSHNSSGWSSGFTARLQDSLPVQGFRMSRSPSPIRAPEVQVSVPDSFQRIITSAKIALDRIDFGLNLLVDVAQIKKFEDMYRELDCHINCLLPYIGMQFDTLNVQGLILLLGICKII